MLVLRCPWALELVFCLCYFLKETLKIDLLEKEHISMCQPTNSRVGLAEYSTQSFRAPKIQGVCGGGPCSLTMGRLPLQTLKNELLSHLLLAGYKRQGWSGRTFQCRVAGPETYWLRPVLLTSLSA